MTYEVQFQDGGLVYTVRCYDLDDAMALIERRRTAPMGKAPDHTGWVNWGGGACPVSPDTRLEVESRNGGVSGMSACYIDWVHQGRPSDIVRYRVCE